MYSNDYRINQLMPQLEQYAGTDEEKFEEIRAEIIRAAIDGYPQEYRKRAEGIQFALDSELDRYKNPVSRMNRMVELFWEKVDEFNVALNKPSVYAEVREQKRTRAKVIPLFSGAENRQSRGERVEA